MPTIALNGYCLLIYTRDATLRSTSFYLVGIQALFEFAINGIYGGIFNVYSMAFFYNNICVSLRTFTYGWNIPKDLNDFPFALLKAVLSFRRWKKVYSNEPLFYNQTFLYVFSKFVLQLIEELLFEKDPVELSISSAKNFSTTITGHLVSIKRSRLLKLCFSTFRTAISGRPLFLTRFCTHSVS